ncbi:MucR family transcriptional regulator [Seohaeicola zhoushanensis]|uniref:MucR family transcriptional regulator n=1 Tax=Seohaeicola zhoushanensis TaxID=1569283 RepID=A0A8J3GTR7_9RHOB|nr:MucR family transcriptional regulator [Seohaeicola zhoushanensis]GHF36168.1 MucR family transcriptional regulator [Seohaeicola zhoushanensis]
MSTIDSKDEMISRIVAAYAGRSGVSPNEIVDLFNRLRHEMSSEAPAEATAPLAADPAQPVEAAVPLDKAMTKDKVYCLCCGKGFKMLKRHIGAEHGLTEAEYRTRFGLPADVPLVAPSYSSKKAKYAKETGFGKYARDPAGKRAGVLNRS